ncbi:SMC5-SMC6 complex localization factor protein 2-like isoform X1 [Xyrauchen texanus]|uniref:SMC5-SMC6 complex localization factor protein 2-like isoform X1 n=2 Tax=Xyrauchen texanus TaxID=154827 RepID=UPI0022419327|nr:SMC5-SMC6 complex localization factor protein 2-like isoform X1 [Xyrauchen texanus]
MFIFHHYKMSSSLKQRFTSEVKEYIPLGTPRRQSLDGISHPVSGRPHLELHKKTPKLLSSLPKRSILPIKNPELEQRDKSNAASIRFQNCSVVVRKLHPKNGNGHSFKDGPLNPMVKKEVKRTSSYIRDKELSIALSKELNKNLRVGGGIFHSDCCATTFRRHIDLQSSHSRPNPESHSSFSFKQRPKSSVNTGQQNIHHPEQRKDREENRNDKPFSNMSLQKELSTPHQKTFPEGRLSLSAKRKGEDIAGNEREIKRPGLDVQLTPSTSIINSPPKYVRRAFLNFSSESVLTIKEKQSPKPLSPTSDTNKPRPPSSLPRQLFKPCKEPSNKSNTESDKPHSFQFTKFPLTGEPKDAMVARGIKNPKTPYSQLQFRKISLKSSTTFGSVETHFTPDPFITSPKTHSKNINGEREGCTVSTHPSSSSSHKDSVKICSPPHQPDLRTPRFSEQASSCKIELDERTQLKEEHSRSPKANMTVPAVSVKVEGSTEKKRCPQWKDPLEIELEDDSGDDLRESCAISLSSSSSGHESDQLPSLREIMDWSVRVPVTPEKDAFSEPMTPVPKSAPEAVKTKAVSYRNTLEQMLREKEQYQRSKELERQLLASCEEDLLNFNEDENSENKDEEISHEQREFLQRFSVASCAIRDIHPGEEVFTPAKFGRLFSHETLDLRKISVTPHNRSQQILLQASTEKVLHLISAGLLRKAYCSFPCQPEVTRWLFQMMSVHPNPITSSRILQSLQTIALSAAERIVETHSRMFKVWVPTVQDIALVFLNMGASFIGLFPLEALEPPFTEGDLLEGFQPEETSHERLISDMKFQISFPVHNLESVLKYLFLCTALCPRAYTDKELLLLLTVTCRIGLETHFQLLPTGHFSLLLQNLLKNITHWEVQISKACQTLTDLSEDHHNLRRLVYLLPESSRGKQLKRHLCVSMISKLLNHTCTYKPSGTEFKISELRPFLPHMRPSSLLKSFRSAKRAEDCDATLDQKAYYLCYSLLTLTNEASNFEFLPSNQRNDLRSLSSQLEKHIKCDIRESEKMLYRSKVKDFVARIYTKWQVLLTRTRPQEGKLYDYWKPPPEDEVPNSPHGQFCITAQDTSESAEETQTTESSCAESDEDADCKEEEDDWPKECEETEKTEENMARENEESMENSVEIGDKSDDQQLMDLDGEDEELFKSPSRFMEGDENGALMNRDEEPHKEDRKHTEAISEELEELEDLLKKDGELLEMQEEVKEEICEMSVDSEKE